MRWEWREAWCFARRCRYYGWGDLAARDDATRNDLLVAACLDAREAPDPLDLAARARRDDDYSRSQLRALVLGARFSEASP
jgi:hypothetical protein